MDEAERRSVQEILELFHRASLDARTEEFYLRCRERKSYLTRERIEEWEIGCAPTLAQCIRAWEAAGFDRNTCERELRSVGLLCDPLSESPDSKPWMFFRDSMLFPYYDGGTRDEGRRTGDGNVILIYFSSRRLTDLDHEGRPLDKQKKALCMRGPDDRSGRLGLPRPAGYNLQIIDDASDEISVVEGCLDAIASCGLNRWSVAQIGGSIRRDLGDRLQAWIKLREGRVLYYLPDGTKDMNPYRRVQSARNAGPLIRMCRLPENKDPDDLTEAQHAEVRECSRQLWREVLALYLQCVNLKVNGESSEIRALGFERADDYKQLWKWLCDWSAAGLTLGEEIWTEYSATFTYLTKDEQKKIREDMGLEGPRRGSGQAGMPVLPRQGAADAVLISSNGVMRFKPDACYPDQPEPPGKAPEGDERRPVVTNVKVEPYKATDEKTGTEETKYKYTALPIDSVRTQVQEALNGYPFRWGAAGEAHPVLFMPDGRGHVRRMQSSKALQTVCMEYATLKFKEKLDNKGTNYGGWDNLYQHFGGSPEVRQYAGVRMRPHEPLVPELFYAWRPPAYEPDLRYLLEALDLFYNIRHPWQKAIFIAAICTPYWGGPRATRPVFVFTADAPGKGKGRASELVSLPAGGAIEIEADKKGEEQLKERALSGDGINKDVIRLDNVKDGMHSPVVESYVTLPEISGKQLYKGEASRPNYFTMLITANNVRVSPDIARRSFFIELDDPKVSGDWEARYQALVANGPELIADCLSVLRTPAPELDLRDCSETFFLWARDVLGRVVHHPVLRSAIGELDFAEILKLNGAIRMDVDDDREQALKFEDYLVRYIAVRGGYVKLRALPDDTEERVVDPPAVEEEVRVSADEVFDAWRRLFGGKISKAWVGRRVTGHIKSKRFRWLAAAPRLSSGSSYLLRANAFTEYLANFKSGEEGLVDVGYEQAE